MSCKTRCTETLPKIRPGVLKIHAVATHGWKLRAWHGACSGVRLTCSVRVNRPLSLTAVFGVAPTRAKPAVDSEGVAVARVPSASEFATLAGLAESVATRDGDPAPTSAVVIPTTRELAAFAMGFSTSEDGPAYLIVLTGNFADDNEPVPSGTVSGPLTGRVIALMIDAGGSDVTDYGIRSTALDEAKIGTPIPLTLS
jgi:hypothetical protein